MIKTDNHRHGKEGRTTLTGSILNILSCGRHFAETLMIVGLWRNIYSSLKWMSFAAQGLGGMLKEILYGIILRSERQGRFELTKAVLYTLYNGNM